MNILTDEEIKAVSDSTFDKVRAMPDDKVNGETWDFQFARAIEAAVLSKLAEQDVEPVAYIVSIDDEPELGHWFSEGPADAEGTYSQKLYTEAQLLAAQQRTAEACAKVCDNREAIEKQKAVALREQKDIARAQMYEQNSGQAMLMAQDLRNGEWREYL